MQHRSTMITMQQQCYLRTPAWANQQCLPYQHLPFSHLRQGTGELPSPPEPLSPGAWPLPAISARLFARTRPRKERVPSRAASSCHCSSPARRPNAANKDVAEGESLSHSALMKALSNSWMSAGMILSYCLISATWLLLV